MPLTELNHFFVRARDLERSRAFYCDALGFEVMPRPDFNFAGYWLGVAGKIQVHMGQDAEGAAANPARDNSGAIDHIAFQGTDPEEIARRLTALGLKFRVRHIQSNSLLQLFVADPDGVMIELNFRGVATLPQWATI
jgi:catechol 2,3-dioxygenase-like lactoylglutathione lyase family enzyme